MIREVVLAVGRRVPFRRFQAERTGTVALEFALVAPALFVLIMGGVEAGRLMWTQSALEMSVAQAARCYAWQVSGCTNATGAQTFATTVAPQLNFATSVFSVSSATCGAKVTASYPYTFIASGLFPLAPTLTASACFPTA